MFKHQAELLKKIRKDSGLTQGMLSRFLCFSSPQLISNVERGLCTFSPDNWKLICDEFGTPVYVAKEAWLKDAALKWV